jgi:hypothetical protein
MSLLIAERLSNLSSWLTAGAGAFRPQFEIRAVRPEMEAIPSQTHQ